MRLIRSARLKLTLYYLLIITSILFIFNILAYRGFVFEITRGIRMRTPRSVDTFYNIPAPLGIISGEAIFEAREDENILAEARKRVVLNLLTINGLILFISGIGSYVLSGQTLKPIEVAMEEQKRFVSDASHELRTPLTAIKTEIEVSLRNKKLDIKEAKHDLKSTLEEVDKIQKLTNYLLTLNRHDTGSSNYQTKTKVDLKKTTESVIKILTPAIRKKNIKIVSRLNDIEIMGNVISLKELITILLDNAIKYSTKGGQIIVSVDKSRNHKAIINIKDNGIGIKASELPFIFNRFYRADTSRSKVYVDGYGLGLSIAKQIVDEHRGKISVSSYPGKGSVFSVTL